MPEDTAIISSKSGVDPVMTEISTRPKSADRQTDRQTDRRTAFQLYIPYVGKFWSGKKLANLANRGLFANILLANYFFLEYSS